MVIPGGKKKKKGEEKTRPIFGNFCTERAPCPLDGGEILLDPLPLLLLAS
jgi:hypothetical protein